MRRWATRALAAISVLSAVGALIFFSLVVPERAGDVESVEDLLSTSTTQLSGTTTTVAATPTTPPPDQSIQPNENGRLDQLSLSTRRIPQRLEIDGIAVDAPVVPYGVNSRTGQMAVPRNVSDVAWYEYGPSPGEPGSAVLAAHVDRSGQGPGVFFRLRELQPGDQVRVSYDDGAAESFVVEARVTYDKDEIPLDTVFSRQGSPVLTLVTCGGGFSESAQTYDSNVVVYAVPLADGTTKSPTTS